MLISGFATTFSIKASFGETAPVGLLLWFCSENAWTPQEGVFYPLGKLSSWSVPCCSALPCASGPNFAPHVNLCTVSELRGPSDGSPHQIHNHPSSGGRSLVRCRRNFSSFALELWAERTQPWQSICLLSNFWFFVTFFLWEKPFNL